MSAIWPSAVATTLQMLQALNNTKVTLNVNAGIGDTTLTVDDASPLPTSGYVTFDDNETNPETVNYTGKSGNNLTGVTRGADSTAAGTHVAGAHLEMRWNAAYHNTLATEIIAIEQNLSDRFGVDGGTHVILAVDGSSTAPAYSFAADTNTGFYRTASDHTCATTGGVIAMEWTASQQIVIPKTSNQLILGSTNTVTISSTAPSASRTYTIPDAGGAASFVMTAGTQTISGATTLSAATITLAADMAAGSHKITGLANGTATTDAAAFGQIKVIQGPIHSSNTGSTSTTSGTPQSTGLTGTITLTNSANRVLIMVSGNSTCASTSTELRGHIFRDSTDLGINWYVNNPGSNNYDSPTNVSLVDSPGDTSAHTYTVKIASSDGSHTVYWNRDSNPTYMQLWEVV